MSAVESVTADLAATNINDNNAAPANNEAVTASAAEGRRLYIGNLAYATKEGELKDFFKEYLVESVSIPVNPRTNRPVGYAFVDLSTPQEAERAINALNGQQVLDRKVSIQLARKPEPHAEGEAGEKEGGESRRRNSTRGRGRGRGRGGRTGRGGRATTKDGEAAPEEAVAATETAPANGTEGDAADKAASTKTPRTPRVPKQRGPPEDGVPSKTKVMVANLPYDLDEDKLIELFKDYSPQSAKIALRPIPRFMIKKLASRNEPRKGRGFGFVTLASEELQQKACNDMNGKEIEGREIAVKVAIDSPGKEDDDLAETAVANGTVPVEGENAAPEAATATA